MILKFLWKYRWPSQSIFFQGQRSYIICLQDLLMSFSDLDHVVMVKEYIQVKGIEQSSERSLHLHDAIDWIFLLHKNS